MRYKPTRKSVYLGFSSSQHDPAVAVVNNEGELVYAQANERVLKHKRAWNTVPDALSVLNEIDPFIGDADAVTAGLSWSNSGLKWSMPILLLSRLKHYWIDFFASEACKEGQKFMNTALRQAMYKAPNSCRDMLLNLEYRLFEKKSPIRYLKKGYDHHRCHAATACYTSPFSEGICLIVDGMGEGSSYAIYAYKNASIKPLMKTPFLNMTSLGFLYAGLCWSLGFDPVAGEEWKVMGLAAYGKKDESFYQLLRPMIKVEGIELKQASDYAQRLTKLLRIRSAKKPPIDLADLAFTGQLIFEEIVVALLNNMHQKFGGENLIIGGGCSLNSTCNGKLIRQSPYRYLHVPMAPGDDGNAMGAAFLAWQEAHPGVPLKPAENPYLGSVYNGRVLNRLCALGKHRVDICDDETVMTQKVAHYLAAGKLIGWFQGRAEFGPRALGNRSILASPVDPNVKTIINDRIKFREEFRPFAPSILHERGPDYFFDYQYAPYMDRTLVFSNTVDAPGVVHVNQTGRLQSVTAELNPLYHQLICQFDQLTGVPMLLNTSFNVMGRPIVHDIEDALGVFYTTGLDVLVIGNHIFVK